MFNHTAATEVASSVEPFQRALVANGSETASLRIRWRYPDAVQELAVLLCDVIAVRDVCAALSLPLSTVYRWVKRRATNVQAQAADDLADTVCNLVARCASEGFDVADAALRRFTERAVSTFKTRLTCVSALQKSVVAEVDGSTLSDNLFFSAPLPRPTAEDRAVAAGIECAKRAMERNCCYEWSGQRLAELAGFSRFTFPRKFASAFGISPHQYLLSLRVQRAVAMLESSERNLDSVADAAGFGSASSMYRAFKRFLGASPARIFYRRARNPMLSFEIKPLDANTRDASHCLPR